MKGMKKFAMIVISLSLLIGACSGGGGGGGNGGTSNAGNVQLSGTISSSSGNYQIAAKPSSLFYARLFTYLGFASPAVAASGDPTIDKVTAIPINSGSLRADSMALSQSATIDPSAGTFNLSLAKDSDWLLMLIDSSATGTGRFVGSLALNAGSSNNLLNFPATDSTLATIDLGTISRPSATTTDALTSRTVGTADFSLSATQITAMAKTDKFFRNAMNIVNNYGQFNNGAGKWYQLRPDFAWTGSLSALVGAGALTVAPSLTYTGMNFQLDQNVDSVTMAQICYNAGIVALHPPASAGTITMGMNTYSYANPIKNSGAGCNPVNNGQETTGSDLYASNGYDHITYSVLASFTSGTIPSGFWEWKENGVVKAAFDVANINPPITPTGQLKGFVPAYRINKDAGNKITSVDVAWFFYDNGVYTPLATADLKVLKHFVQSIEAKFDVTYNGSRRTCDMYIDPTVETSFNPADPRFASSCQADPQNKDWYYQNPSHPETNTGLMGFYETGGFGYFFHYN